MTRDQAAADLHEAMGRKGAALAIIDAIDGRIREALGNTSEARTAHTGDERLKSVGPARCPDQDGPRRPPAAGTGRDSSGPAPAAFRATPAGGGSKEPALSTPPADAKEPDDLEAWAEAACPDCGIPRGDHLVGPGSMALKCPPSTADAKGPERVTLYTNVLGEGPWTRTELLEGPGKWSEDDLTDEFTPKSFVLASLHDVAVALLRALVDSGPNGWSEPAHDAVAWLRAHGVDYSITVAPAPTIEPTRTRVKLSLVADGACSCGLDPSRSSHRTRVVSGEGPSGRSDRGMTKTKNRAVVICTAKRGVFFGYTPESNEAIIKRGTVVLERARMCTYWSAATKGVTGLAVIGPQAGSKIGAQVSDLTCESVTGIFGCSEKAAKVWEEGRWS